MEFFIGADKRTVRTLCLDVEVAVVLPFVRGIDVCGRIRIHYIMIICFIFHIVK